MIVRQIVAFVILLAVMVQSYNKAFIVFDYYINTNSFAVNCENKSRPEMHCNGQCQMIKKLKQEENKDTQNPQRKASANDEVISSRSFFFEISLINLHKEISVYSTTSDPRVIGRPRAFFHPPNV